MYIIPIICLSVAFFYSIRLGFAQMNHSIEDRTAQSIFDLLVGLTTRLELAADEMLIAIDERFGQRTSMIAPFLFPPLAPLASNGSQNLIARQRRGLTVAMLLDFSIFAQRESEWPLGGVANASNTFCLS